MNIEQLEAAEMELRRWHANAPPTAENFTRYAARLEAIAAGRLHIRQLTRAQAAQYKTTIDAYRASAAALKSLKNESKW